MHASKCRNSIEAGSLSSESVNYRSVISPVHWSTPIYCHGKKESIGHTKRVAGSQCPAMTTAQEDRHIVRSALKKSINHITNHLSGNGHLYSTPSFRPYNASKFAATWPVSSETINLASLDNAA